MDNWNSGKPHFFNHFIFLVLASSLLSFSSSPVFGVSFLNSSEPMGSNSGVFGGSIQWGDYDQDGLLDLAVSGEDNSTTNRLIIFQNQGDGTFNKAAEPMGGPGSGVTKGDIQWGDYDNDGDLDLVVSGGDNSGTPRLFIYRNDGSNSFTQVANADLIGSNKGVSFFGSVQWGDYDNDGDLDLAVSGQDNSGNLRLIIYRNDGNNNFTNVAEPMSLDGSGVQASSIQWGDYDNDDDLDLIVSGFDQNANSRLILYRNDGNDVFTKVLDPLGVTGLKTRSSAQWGDYDQDGDLDLAVSGLDGSSTQRLIIYRNDGNGSFTQVDEPMGSSQGLALSSIQWGDYDNDGYLDLAVAGQDNSGNQRLVVFRYVGGDNFSNTAEPLGTNSGVEEGNIQWGDYDSDGDLDLAVSGNDATNYRLIVYENDAADTTQNSRPSKPTGLSATKSGTTVTFSWDSSTSDDHTPPASITYNLRVGTGPQSPSIKSADVASDSIGAELLGNVQLGDTAAIQGIRSDSLPLYWSVQAVDGGKMRSKWAPEQIFTLNDAPVIDPAVSNQKEREDTGSWLISLTDRASDTEGQNMKWVIANPADTLVNTTLSKGAYLAGGEDTLTLDPIADASGTSSITVGLGDGVDTTTQSFEVVLSAVNDSPVIVPEINDQTLREDTMSKKFPLDARVSDTDGDLLKWLSSGADTLVGTIFDQGTYVSGGDDTLTLKPKLDAYGTSTLNLSVGDGRDTVSQTISIVVTPDNDTPVIDPPVPDQTFFEDTGSIEIPLISRATDTEGESMKWVIADGADTLVNSSLANNSFNGSGKDTLTLTTVNDATGTSAITLRLGDGNDTASQTFQVEITANNVPVIDPAIADQALLEDTGPLNLVLSDNAFDSDGQALKWTANGADTLVNLSFENGTYVVGGSDTLTLSPQGNAAGTSAVTLNLGDGQDTVSQDIQIVITSNDTPLLSPPVPDQTLIEDTDPKQLALKNRASDSNDQAIKWTVQGGGSVVNVSLLGTGFTDKGDDTLTISPISGKTGAETITLFLGDGDDTITQDVQVTVLNKYPVISLERIQVERSDTPLIANGSGTRSVNLTFSNSGNDGSLNVDTADLSFRDSDGTIQSFDLTLPGGETTNVSRGDTGIATWAVHAPTPDSSALTGTFRLVLDTPALTVSSDTDQDVGSPDQSNLTYQSKLRVASVVEEIVDASIGLDTSAQTLQDLEMNGGIADNNSMFDTSLAGFSNGDSLVMFFQRGDTGSFDTPVTNPSYGFSGRDDFLTTIDNADQTFFGKDTSPVNDALMTISFWKNEVGSSSNYVGDSDVLTEDVNIAISRIDYSGNTNDLRVAKLLPGSKKWSVIDSNPTVTGSSGDHTVTFSVDSSDSESGAGFSVFRIITGGGISNTGTADDVVVYPNPFKPHDGDPNTGQYGLGSGQGIHFGAGSNVGFPAGTSLSIFNVTGEKIDELRTSTGGIIQWDAKTRNGDAVASGVYIFHLDVPNGGTKIGKFTIIR